MKNFIFKKKNINIIERIRIPENRDLAKGIRLNRNERVENFEKNILLKIFKDSKNYDLAKYPDQTKIYYTLSNFLKFKKENILITSGIDGAIKSIFEIFSNHGDTIAVLSPTYAMYKIYSELFKTKIISVGYKNFKLEKNLLYEIINTGKIKILFIPNPNQPIEDNISFKEMGKISKLCKKKKILLVVDEAYHMFGSETSAKLCLKNEHVIVLRTLSKAFGLPSIRFGYILAHCNMVKILNSYRLSYESNYLTDKVVGYFIKNFNKIKKYNEKIIKGRNYFKKNLQNLGVNVIGGKANFLLVDFKKKEILNKVLIKFKKYKIYVKSNYPGNLENCILVTCGSIKTMKKLFKIIKPEISR